MSVRKRTWYRASEINEEAGALGLDPKRDREDVIASLIEKDRPPQQAWVVDYIDGHGDRHIETFRRRKMPMTATTRSRSM